MTRTLALLLLVVLAVAPAVQAQADATAALAAHVATPHPDDSLYRDLGGQAGVDALAAEFVRRLATDARTGEFFRNVKQPHLREMLAQTFCVVAGGPCHYTGRPIDQVHHDMDITKGDFNAVVEVLQAAMDARHIPFATQNRLLAQLAPMHRDIVTVH